MIDITAFRTEGLGDTTYLVRAGDTAALIDPQRDIDRFLDELDGAELRWVLETHLHNDYVSGGRSAARVTGAELVLPAGAAPAFRHTPAFHNEDLADGALTVRPLHTPGHTPEHVSYLIIFDGRIQGVFSGGSLLVGSAGRSDLLGAERADTLARLQYRSVKRLTSLADETPLYPTHGAGSFCSAGTSGSHTSTIGQERRTNPVATHPDEDSFVAAHLSGLQPYPRYYARMGPINLAGPEPLPDLDPAQVKAPDIEDGAVVVDLRTAPEFASGHLPGSINIPLSNEFGTWFGWLIPADTLAYLVAGPETDVDQALMQLARIGIDRVKGVVVDLDDRASVQSRTGDISEVPHGSQILDVRSPGEREAGAPESSTHQYLPDLIDGAPESLDPTRPVWVACASGYRAAIAASLLRRQGYDAIPVTGDINSVRAN